MSNRYINVPKKKINGKQLYQTVIYPEIPLNENDTYVYTTQGDRFDLLAQRYYGNQSYWWIISSANPSIPQNSLIIPEGIQIRIPVNPSRILSSFNSLNNVI
jgi:phage tail protein X